MESTSYICLGAAFLNQKHERGMVVSHGYKDFSDRAMRTRPQGLTLIFHATAGTCCQLSKEHDTLRSDHISENKKHDQVWVVSYCKKDQTMNHQVCLSR